MGCVVLLSIAATLSPDTTGMGTHQQLGYPPCVWPMVTGYPCPTCGMTTAFAHAVRGRLWSAFLAQPAGLMLAIGILIAALVSAWSLLTGWVCSVNWYRLLPDRVAMSLVAMIAAGWVFKLVMVWLARSQAIGS